jgi:hypothetical protein
MAVISVVPNLEFDTAVHVAGPPTEGAGVGADAPPPEGAGWLASRIMSITSCAPSAYAEILPAISNTAKKKNAFVVLIKKP